MNGIQEGAAEIRLAPQGPGRSSIGTRINKVNYFKGAIHLARFTRRALSPAEFLKVSDGGSLQGFRRKFVTMVPTKVPA